MDNNEKRVSLEIRTRNVNRTINVTRKGAPATGKTMKTVGTGTKYFGKGVSFAYKGLDSVGQGINKAGTSLNSTGAGVSDVGKEMNVAGNTKEKTGDTTKKDADSVDKIGEKVNNVSKDVKHNKFERWENQSQANHPIKSAIRDRVNDVTKIRQKIKFFQKYKYIIILGSIAFLIIILFMFLIMSFEAMGLLNEESSGSNSGSVSSPTTSYLSNLNSECESINVNGTLYDLEEYVAGVVTNEAYTSMGMEALKAQAITARTYAIFNTGNCQSNIGNSTNTQTFNPNIDENARQAAESTAGLVLTYEGNIFSSQYDSYCYQDNDCPDSTCSGDTCSVTYTKLPKEETHKITIPSTWSSKFVPGGGHARGMSQLLSYEMANNGSTYVDIIGFFYSPGVVIAQLSGESTGVNSGVSGSFTIRTKAPTQSDWAWSGEYSASNVGQCVWYTKGRMLEIINEAVTDKTAKEKSMSVINSTYGNGCTWYNETLLNTFGGTTDVTKPKAGALIVWKYASGECNVGTNYGHTAMIESVSDDGKVIVTEAWATGGNSCPNDWDCINFSSSSFKSIDEFVNWVNSYSSTTYGKFEFLGYIYLLG